MLDRMREALFNTISLRIDGARVLDLFAGSGSLGLEALSRGARAVRMIDRDPEALRVLRANTELLRVGDRAEIVRGDALEPGLWPAVDQDDAADIVFLDPPYPLVEDPRGRELLLERIGELIRDVLEPGGILVLHARKIRARELAEAHPTWDQRVYGSSALLYIGREPGTEPGSEPGPEEDSA